MAAESTGQSSVGKGKKGGGSFPFPDFPSQKKRPNLGFGARGASRAQNDPWATIIGIESLICIGCNLPGDCTLSSKGSPSWGGGGLPCGYPRHPCSIPLQLATCFSCGCSSLRTFRHNPAELAGHTFCRWTIRYQRLNHGFRMEPIGRVIMLL